MSRQIQIRRGTADQHNSFTGAIGEITMDTTNNTLRVHDGSTVGGHNILNESKVNEKLSAKINTDADNFTSTGKSKISNLCMPNYTNYDVLTIGASDAEYTAPADGYFAARIEVYSNGYVQATLDNDSSLAWTAPNTCQISFIIPIKKGSKMKLGYSNRTNANYQSLRFIYTNSSI